MQKIYYKFSLKIDLADIKVAYEKMYNISLYDEVQREVSGDNAKLLLALVKKA